MNANAPAERIIRPRNPEQLDRMLHVVPPAAWPALVVLATLLLGGLVWSIVSSAPVKVTAQGILLTPSGVADVVASAGGRLVRLDAQPGQRIRKGQPVAEIDQPEIASQLETQRRKLASLRDQGARLRAFQETEQAARARIKKEREANLKIQIASLDRQEQTLSTLAKSQRELLSRGYSSNDRVLSTESRLYDAQSQRAEAENTLVQLHTDEAAARTRAAREVLENEMSIAEVEREIAALAAEIDRKTVVLAPRSGIVVEAAVNPGEMVTADAPILRMLPDGEEGGDAATLVGLIYVPAADGKKIRPGMAVQVIPSTVRVQRDGFIHGEVTAVSAIPASRESMMRVLKNTSLVEQLMADGPPLATTVRLDADPATVSGFRWSSGHGPAQPVDSGTIAEGRVVVDRIRLIALLVPQAETVLRRFGL